MITAISGNSAAAPAQSKSGFSSLGMKDFVRLLTTQLSQQDPTAPVDNKDMLAQMAQFSSLSGINDVNDTLKQISVKLDAVLSAQSAAASVAAP